MMIARTAGPCGLEPRVGSSSHEPGCPSGSKELTTCGERMPVCTVGQIIGNGMSAELGRHIVDHAGQLLAKVRGHRLLHVIPHRSQGNSQRQALELVDL